MPRTVAALNPNETADSDTQLSSPPLTRFSAKPGLQDTPDSTISTEDDAAAAGVDKDGDKPYDPDAVGKKSHDRAVARAIVKLKYPSPCLSTPSPKSSKSAKPILVNTPTSQIQRSWSGASSETDTFCTPTAQVRPPLERHDTKDSDSAVQELLNCTDEETPPRVASADVAPVGSFTPSVFNTPGSEADVTQTSSSQDSLATLPVDNTSDASPSDNTSDASPSDSRDDSSGTSDATPTSSVSSSSQAKEVVDITPAGSKLEHDEYMDQLLDHSKKVRVLLKPGTRNPRLHQHRTTALPALLVFDAIDDGVRVCSAGIQWSVDGRFYDVVVVASLGWRSYKKNTRSHQVRPAGPVYAFLRDGAYMGTKISFGQLRKVHIHTLFTKGKPAAEVDVDVINKTLVLGQDFITKNKREVKLWSKVPTFRFLDSRHDTVKKKIFENNTETEEVPLSKRSSKRIQKLEAEHRVRHQLEEKIKNLELDNKRKMLEYRKAKLEAQKNQRELQKQIKAVVRETMEKFKASITRQLRTVKGTVGSNKKNFEAKLREIENMGGEVRDALEAELGVRVQNLHERVEQLTSGLDECNELRVKCTKRTREMIDTMNTKWEYNNRQIQKKQKKLENAHKKRNKAKANRHNKKRQNENYQSTPPAAPAIVSRPPTPMVALRSDPFQMFTSPPVPTPVPTFGQHYVSPTFANRNYAR